jgi:hypothetical protein
VHRAFVCALALLLLVWSATDRLCCLDDCGRDDLLSTTVAPMPAPDCPLCSGIVTTAIEPFTTDIAAVETLTDCAFVPAILLLVRPLERPPRLLA